MKKREENGATGLPSSKASNKANLNSSEVLKSSGSTTTPETAPVAQQPYTKRSDSVSVSQSKTDGTTKNTATMTQKHTTHTISRSNRSGITTSPTKTARRVKSSGLESGPKCKPSKRPIPPPEEIPQSVKMSIAFHPPSTSASNQQLHAGGKIRSPKEEYLFHALAFCDSYSRLPAILNLRGISQREWFSILGEEWSTCDNISEYRSKLLRRFSTATREDLDAMMTDEERGHWEALPEQLTVFRGCSPLNTNGLSFSLSRDVAEKFPFRRRFKAALPMLVTAEVPKRRTALNLSRDEDEIIIAAPKEIKIISIEPILEMPDFKKEPRTILSKE